MRYANEWGHDVFIASQFSFMLYLGIEKTKISKIWPGLENEMLDLP